MDCICLSVVLIVWVHRHAIKLTLSPSQVILISDYISSKLLELLKECFFSMLFHSCHCHFLLCKNCNIGGKRQKQKQYYCRTAHVRSAEEYVFITALCKHPLNEDWTYFKHLINFLPSVRQDSFIFGTVQALLSSTVLPPFSFVGHSVMLSASPHRTTSRF